MSEEIKRMRLPVNRIKPGMKVAEDVYTPKGLMLMKKNSIIDEKNIFRINLYQIMSILILIEEDKKVQVPDRLNLEVTQNFQEFKEKYVIHHQLTQKYLDNVFKGDLVSEEDLYHVSAVLVESLRTRSELFSYMYSLKDDDDYTYTHCLNVSVLANVFAKWLKLDEEQTKEVTIAGLLHDVGKLKIDNEILNKPGRLTKEEFEVMKKHSAFGYETIKSQDLSDEIKSAVLFHHEKLDGSGYPLGLRDEKIPLYAKIVGIVDIYDAMTSKRSYHDRYSPFRVIRMFEEESYGFLDTKLLFVFLENIAHNYLGKEVILSNGDQGKIVFIHNESPSRPIVKVKGDMIDLLFNMELSIEKLV